MNPSISTPQDAFKGATRPGWWTCFLCSPPVHDQGGQSAWMAHYLRKHWTEHYREVKP